MTGEIEGKTVFDEDRRLFDRRNYERRLRAREEYNASRAGHCLLLDMLITPEGCMKIRHRTEQPQCKDCPGVHAEKRHGDRRSGVDRRLGKMTLM